MSNQVAQKKQLPAFLVLTIICLVAALALAATNAITAGPIREHELAAQREAFGAVMQADEYVELTIPEGSDVSALVEAKVNGETVGYCVVASQNGYAGPVAVTLGIDLNGVITGAKIGDNNFVETNGFGSKWRDNAAKAEEFLGVDIAQGGAIEAISGATVTSKAVLGASNAALAAVNTVLGNERTEPVLVFGVKEEAPVNYADSVAAGDYTATAQGFQSEVKVTFTVDENSTITALTVDSTGETPSYGTRCAEDEAFVNQFIGKTVPVESIDVLSGATVTSNAVLTAVNSVAQAEEAAVTYAPVAAGDYTATAQGFQSEVSVTFTVDENSTITALTMDTAGETPNFGTRCAEDEAFVNQFIGKTVPVESIDVLSGATVTSNAVLTAVNSVALVSDSAAEEETPAVEASTETETETSAETLTASAKGLLSDVTVTVTLNEDGTIATMVVDASGETPAIAGPCTEEAYLAQFIGKAGPFADADVVAGATFTSNAIIEAVNSLFPAEEAPAAGDDMTGKAQGFQSEVTVTLTVNEGVITAIKVDASNETPGFGTRCGEDEAFLAQFVGKKATPDLGEGIEVLSGATVTSNAVVEAANAAIGVAVAEVEIPAAETLTASAKGLLSDVTVTVTLNEDGTIATMTVDASGETPAIAGPCTEEAYLAQFIGKAGPFADADVVAGATFTSNAIIEAVNSLFPAEEAPAAGDDMTGKAQGFQSEVTVTLTVNEGVITAIKVDASNETPGFGTRCGEDEAFLAQFVGKKATPDLGEGIEVLSGATVTSNAVVEAANAAIGVAVAEVEIPAAETLTASAKGLLSDVTVTVTLNEDGTIATMTVDASGETPAIAGPCTEEAYLAQFIGKAGPFADADVVAGATFTSNAIIEAVNSLFAAE